MLHLEYARDLVMLGAIFGGVAFAWAGWAQERPPKGVIWRVVLVVLQISGLVLLACGIVGAVRFWETPTALVSGSPALVVYIIVFWAEVAAIVVIAVLAVRTKRTRLIAPAVLIIVGVHFVPLAFVFGQPIVMLAAVLITFAGVASTLLPRSVAAPSFWCGVLAAPIFLVIGAFSLVAALGALEA